MLSDDDVVEWLDRLGIDQALPPTFETLRRLAQRHQNFFPFENIDVFCGSVPSLELSDLVDKLIRKRRGGYCFELNALLAAGLTALGFEVRPLMARVIWEREEPGPRTHAFLCVAEGGDSWLVDVGFGGPGPVEPIEMKVDGASVNRGGSTHILEYDPNLRFVLKRLSRLGRRAPLYAFDLENVTPNDLAVGNDMAASMPGSIFRKELKVARQTPCRRITLNGREFKRHVDAEFVERKTLRSAEEVIACLDTHFDIRLNPAKERVLVDRLNEGFTY